MKKALITGITGQDAAYLSKLLLDKGYRVFGLTRQAKPDLVKLQYLGIKEKVSVRQCDMLDANRLREIIKETDPDEIYNLAGQSSVDYSIKHPDETIRFNVNSVLNLLEAVRTINPKIRIYQASTSEMYGDKTAMPISESSAIDPVNPYGVSKAAGYFMAKNYRESFGIFAVNGVLFNHESHLRNPEYFMRRLIITALNISKGKDEYVYLGQDENMRDFGYSPKYVEAIWLSLQAKSPSDYVVCSGRPVSIRKVTEYVLNKLNVPLDRIKIDKKLFREPNVASVYGDNSKAKRELGWSYDLDFFQVLDMLIEEEKKNYGKTY